jgi:15-cis-phytoene synthase
MRSRSAETNHAIDLAACRATLRHGSRTFFAASHVLPRRVSEPATALYAFCRLVDDAVDLHSGKIAALARLRQRLDLAYAGRPFPAPTDRAFAEIVARFAIPRALPEALLDGLAWDAESRRYEDFSALQAYAVRVAGAVGAMVSILMGARTPQLLARACDLGVAMQLTNIARDVGEDAREGRLYLPLQWLRAAGIDPDEWLARPVFSEALGAVVLRLLAEADVLYARSDAGIRGLPLACRPGIHAARLLYAEIGRQIQRGSGDSVSRRAVVSWQRKALLLVQSLVAIAMAERSDGALALQEAQYLIDSVTAAPPLQRRRNIRPSDTPGALEGRLVWLIDLFEQLERRENLVEAVHNRGGRCRTP